MKSGSIKISLYSKPITMLAVILFGLMVAIGLIMTMEKVTISLKIVFLIIITAIWILSAGKNWWITFPSMAFMGVIFWAEGFKIYPDELGLLLTILALIAAFIKNRDEVIQKRSPIPWAFSLLIVYFFLHMSYSFYLAHAGILAGGGSIIRAYSSGFVFLVFCWLYYKFGSSENVKTAFIAIFVVMIFRIIVSLVLFFSPTLINISETSLVWLRPTADLRFSALYQIMIAIVLFYFVKKKMVQNFIIILIVFLFFSILLGQGRVSVAMGILTIILWSFMAKKFRLWFFMIPVTLVLITFLYSNLNLLSSLPLEVQRSLSFIPGLKSFLIYETARSNEWHYSLFVAGFQRWSASVYSILLGNPVDPTGLYEFGIYNFFDKLNIAASTGRYECTLLTVLATLGIVGTFLYIMIFMFLFREIIPIVRREGIISFNHAVYGIAIISLLLMILFGWIHGGFPGIELLFGVMAKALYEDTKLKKITNT